MPTKILMVCLGNICRSPLAEGILKSKLPTDAFEVDSAGTGGWHAGEHPDKRSILTAKNHRIDISNQRARQFKLADFQDFDYIFAMDNNNYRDIIRLAPDEASKNKVRLILNELHPGENISVPDPYYGGQAGFEQVFNLLDEACDILAYKLKTHHL